MEKLYTALLVAAATGIFFLAYNNPKGYSYLMEKLAEFFPQMWLIIICFSGGIHFTFWELEIPYEDNNLYSYVIPNFAYIWGTTALLLIFYLLLISIGKLLKELKVKGDD
ncbi:hypothetical protein H5085_14615 [Pseudoalteromonas sp. SR43-6]|uniref:Transmembrane protein n=1 Tax=Pseudoalteromonas distincta TaxID=77608 RepID=A0ABT9GCN0_9GAMM|nr:MULTISPECIES: hypothetical protein [Pseudoalteromonas]KHM50402.1 hypothetical protein PL71_04310 [Pseudoalteromonas elyakovii]KID36853.1 hypothetical protein QT16_12540 [Pseudoalteromonas distincta]MBB1289966.1 hypothetical protein [Pseudoalteromonas sp. SR41-5]MBB1375530.1 hypothetical protein [Pseudoalteromonas sp. SR43-6]MBB1414540.1 hypothetical protein [Pseudoalteromonas sp. SG43-8]